MIFEDRNDMITFLRREVDTSSYTKAEIARQLDVSRSYIQQLLGDGSKKHSVESYNRLANVLGYTIVVTEKYELKLT